MSTGYKILLVLHILAAVTAVGPLFLLGTLQRADADGAATLYTRVSLPALVLTWVFGMGLIGTSDDLFSMSDGWVIGSLVVWLLLLAVGVFGVRTSLGRRGLAGALPLPAALGISHLLAVVAIYLMVFKPGA